jgi:hypothetical protein
VRVCGSQYPDQRHRVPLGYLRTGHALSSDGSTIYILHQLGDGSWTCECLGFLHQSRSDGRCRHIDQMRNPLSFDLVAAGLL